MRPAIHGRSEIVILRLFSTGHDTKTMVHFAKYDGRVGVADEHRATSPLRDRETGSHQRASATMTMQTRKEELFAIMYL